MNPWVCTCTVTDVAEILHEFITWLVVVSEQKYAKTTWHLHKDRFHTSEADLPIETNYVSSQIVVLGYIRSLITD